MQKLCVDTSALNLLRYGSACCCTVKEPETKRMTLQGRTQGTKWRALGIASPCPAHAPCVAPESWARDQLPRGHWSHISGAASPHPPSSSMSPHEQQPPRPLLGSDLALGLVWMWHGNGIDFLMVDICHLEQPFCASYLVASLWWLPSHHPHSKEHLDQMHHWVFTLSFVL